MNKILSTLVLSGGLALNAAVAETLTIGAATAQTGGLAYYDGSVMEGVRMHIDQINAEGGIMGKIKIKMMEKDVRSDAAQTAIAVQELVDQDVSVVILPSDADPGLAAAGIVDSAQIPSISGAATSPTLPLIGGDYVFANFPGDNIQATASAQWAYDQGFRRAYLIYSPDMQYTTLPLYFGDVMKKLGGEVVGQSTYTLEQQDFSAIVTKIKSMNPQPDVIMTAAFDPDFPSLLKGLRSSGVTAQVIGSDGLDSPTTFALGSVGEGVVFSTGGFAKPGNPLDKFYKMFKEKTGKDANIFTAAGYDLINVVKAAVVATGGSTDSKKIRDAMANLVNVQGVTSKITYKGTTGMPIRQVSLVQVHNGKPKLLGQPAPKASLVPAPRMQ